MDLWSRAEGGADFRQGPERDVVRPSRFDAGDLRLFDAGAIREFLLAESTPFAHRDQLLLYAHCFEQQTNFFADVGAVDFLL
jgi:hypothetical protein